MQNVDYVPSFAELTRCHYRAVKGTLFQAHSFVLIDQHGREHPEFGAFDTWFEAIEFAENLEKWRP